MHQISYNVTGLTCGGCVARVKSTLSPFADGIEVTLNPPQATLTNCKADIQTLNDALSEVGKYALHAKAPTNTLLTTIATDANNMNENLLQQNGFKQNWFKNWIATYHPLLLIVCFILLVSIGIQFSPIFANQPFDYMQWMMHFMAGFFLVFSFFKLLDIRGFANSYAMYDLLARRVNAYGYIYPFIELGLGIAYLLAWQPMLTNSVTFAIMSLSSLGVICAVFNKQKIRCACLGAVFNLPMSTVTIIEDLLMAGMALWMLF
jgi:cation transport ATPase